jgi:hypothetical protein
MMNISPLTDGVIDFKKNEKMLEIADNEVKIVKKAKTEELIKISNYFKDNLVNLVENCKERRQSLQLDQIFHLYRNIKKINEKINKIHDKIASNRLVKVVNLIIKFIFGINLIKRYSAYQEIALDPIVNSQIRHAEQKIVQKFSKETSLENIAFIQQQIAKYTSERMRVIEVILLIKEKRALNEEQKTLFMSQSIKPDFYFNSGWIDFTIDGLLRGVKDVSSTEQGKLSARVRKAESRMSLYLNAFKELLEYQGVLEKKYFKKVQGMAVPLRMSYSSLEEEQRIKKQVKTCQDLSVIKQLAEKLQQLKIHSSNLEGEEVAKALEQASQYYNAWVEASTNFNSIEQKAARFIAA